MSLKLVNCLFFFILSTTTDTQGKKFKAIDSLDCGMEMLESPTRNAGEDEMSHAI